MHIDITIISIYLSLRISIKSAPVQLYLIVCAIGILMVVQPCFLFHKNIAFPETVSPSNQVWRDIDSNQSLYVRLSLKEQCTM